MYMYVHITLIISKITPAALLAATWPTIPWETYKEGNKRTPDPSMLYIICNIVSLVWMQTLATWDCVCLEEVSAGSLIYA